MPNMPQSSGLPSRKPCFSKAKLQCNARQRVHQPRTALPYHSQHWQTAALHSACDTQRPQQCCQPHMCHSQHRCVPCGAYVTAVQPLPSAVSAVSCRADICCTHHHIARGFLNICKPRRPGNRLHSSSSHLPTPASIWQQQQQQLSCIDSELRLAAPLQQHEQVLRLHSPINKHYTALLQQQWQQPPQHGIHQPTMYRHALMVLHPGAGALQGQQQHHQQQQRRPSTAHAAGWNPPDQAVPRSWRARLAATNCPACASETGGAAGANQSAAAAAGAAAAGAGPEDPTDYAPPATPDVHRGAPDVSAAGSAPIDTAAASVFSRSPVPLPPAKLFGALDRLQPLGVVKPPVRPALDALAAQQALERRAAQQQRGDAHQQQQTPQHLLTWRGNKLPQVAQPMSQEQPTAHQLQQQQQQQPSRPFEQQQFLTSPVSFVAATTHPKGLAGSLAASFGIHSHQLVFASGPLAVSNALKGLATVRGMVTSPAGAEPMYNVLMQPTIRSRAAGRFAYALDIAKVGPLPLPAGRATNQKGHGSAKARIVNVTGSCDERALARGLVEHMPKRGHTLLRVAGPYATDTAVLTVALARPMMVVGWGQDLAVLATWDDNQGFNGSKTGLLLSVFRCAVGTFPPAIQTEPPTGPLEEQAQLWQRTRQNWRRQQQKYRHRRKQARQEVLQPQQQQREQNPGLHAEPQGPDPSLDP